MLLNSGKLIGSGLPKGVLYSALMTFFVKTCSVITYFLIPCICLFVYRLSTKETEEFKHWKFIPVVLSWNLHLMM